MYHCNNIYVSVKFALGIKICSKDYVYSKSTPIQLTGIKIYNLCIIAFLYVVIIQFQKLGR